MYTIYDMAIRHIRDAHVMTFNSQEEVDIFKQVLINRLVASGWRTTDLRSFSQVKFETFPAHYDFSHFGLAPESDAQGFTIDNIFVVIDTTEMQENDYVYNEFYDWQKIIDLNELPMVRITHPNGSSTFLHKSEINAAYRSIKQHYETISKVDYAKTQNLQYESIINTCKSNIENCKINISRYKTYVESYSRDIINYERIIKSEEVMIEKTQAMLDTNTDTTEIENEIEKIRNHAKCKELAVTTSGIHIITERLIIYEPVNNKYYMLGSMLFHIPFDKRKPLKFYNMEDTKEAYENNMQHPHIWSYGEPCYGNSDAQFACLRQDNEYMALYLTMVDFCESVDIYDSAGIYVGCWDEVTKTGEIIKYGVSRSEISDYCCPVCNEYIEDEEDLRYCEYCDRDVCYDCYDNDLGMCHECRSREYVICEGCDKWVPEEDMYRIQGTDLLICSDCIDSNPDYTWCSSCGEVCFVNDCTFDEVTGKYICNECNESL